MCLGTSNGSVVVERVEIAILDRGAVPLVSTNLPRSVKSGIMGTK